MTTMVKMKAVALTHLKAHLSAFVAKVRRGEEVLITERGHPVARLVPLHNVAVPERLASLAAQGRIRLARRPSSKRWLRPQPIADPSGGVLKALLEERELGR